MSGVKFMSSHYRRRRKAAAIVLLYYLLKKKERTCYAREINKKRNELGEYVQLYQEIKEDPDQFVCYTRMKLPLFNFLLGMIAPLFENTRLTTNTIPIEARLAMTLK